MGEKILTVHSEELLAALYNAYNTGYIVGVLSEEDGFEKSENAPPVALQRKEQDASTELHAWVKKAHAALVGRRTRQDGTVGVPDLFK